MRGFVCSVILLTSCVRVTASETASDDVPDEATGSSPLFEIAGSLSGLVAGSVTLQLGNEQLTLTADGGFTFAAQLPSGSAYQVTIAAQPSGLPMQDCVVSGSQGTIADQDVANVTVHCSVARFSVSA